MANSKIDTAAQKKTLLDQKQELESLIETRDGATDIVNLDQARTGRVSRVGAMQAQEMAIEANRRRAAHITEIEHALQKIEEGDYGLCEECGKDIPEKRLEFDAAATLCIECAEKAEKLQSDS